jgi:hypothetical protein
MVMYAMISYVPSMMQNSRVEKNKNIYGKAPDGGLSCAAEKKSHVPLINRCALSSPHLSPKATHFSVSLS